MCVCAAAVENLQVSYKQQQVSKLLHVLDGRHNVRMETMYFTFSMCTYQTLLKNNVIVEKMWCIQALNKIVPLRYSSSHVPKLFLV